ncbi:hypothetical protein [Alkaliphilus serpentinus]|uniref:Uncharacterized protein n=1 Tax=Alkaliphilus serpentinus TaxID=1482731 RepID=A0A833M6D2_9FIRM|nr:hypothetical protein [Alkaliphilus serpentinus]KAB3527249.1 hypothetical protein F8153_12680 [Alkaliphilus serpentinus]
MLYGYIIILSLFTLLLGYGIGRRIGLKEGYKKATVELPFILKEKLYENNICPICNRREIDH